MVEARKDSLVLKIVGGAEGAVKKLLIGGLRVYRRFISPMLPYSCRFYPTCSQYCIEAIEKRGVVRGVFAGIMRIMRCNQLFRGGFDPLR